MYYKYLATDLDGTIVKPDDYEIMDETLEDIINFQNKSGNKLFIVTGRNYTTAKRYASLLKVNLPIITSNGAVIIDPITGNVLFERCIDRQKVINILNFSIKNNIDLTLYNAKEMMGKKDSERVMTSLKMTANWEQQYKPTIFAFNNLNELKDFIKEKNQNISKALFSIDQDDKEKQELLIDFLSNMGLDHPTLFMHNRLLVEALEPNINKALGLAKWAEIMKTDVKEIITFGDNNNDMEMTKQSNYGIAVGNAIDNLKKEAWKVIDSINNNGVGNYIKTLIK